MPKTPDCAYPNTPYTHTLRNGWQVHILSGAGSKAPAAIVLQTPHWRLLLDAGATLNPAEHGRTEPWLAPALAGSTHAGAAMALDAALISHDHVDHIGAAHQLPAQLPLYATAQVAKALPAQAVWRELPLQGITRLHKENAPALCIRTGANGHSLGGVWLHIADEDASTEGLFYSGDFSLESSLFAFDAPPRSELALLDASYGRSTTSQTSHIEALKALLEQPTILPVPASGRALELALWLTHHTPHSWAMDAACHAALDMALQAPPAQFQPGVYAQLQALQTRREPTGERAGAWNTYAHVLLVADPEADGLPSRFLEAWKAAQAGQQTASHQVIYTGYRPPAPNLQLAHGAAPAAQPRTPIQEHSLRWNVHPRLQDVAQLLTLTGAPTWQPLFTDALCAADISPNAP